MRFVRLFALTTLVTLSACGSDDGPARDAGVEVSDGIDGDAGADGEVVDSGADGDLVDGDTGADGELVDTGADGDDDATEDTTGPDTADVAGDTGDDADTADGDTDDTDADTTPSNTRYLVCHEGVDTIVAEVDRQAHLDHGDASGPCSPLTATLRPESDTVIDCAGRTIDAAAVDTFAFFHDVERARVEGCTVLGVGFGVVVLGGRDNVIADNHFEVTSDGVTLLASDDNLVDDNVINYRGLGVVIARGASRNALEDNQLTVAAGDVGSARPGLDRPHLYPDGGPAVLVDDAPDVAVVTFVIGGEVFQVDNRDITLDGNAIRRNRLVGGDPAAIVIGARSAQTRVANNDISGAEYGVRVSGSPDGTGLVTAGGCAGDATRACQFDDDCSIAGVDAASSAPCTGVGSMPGAVVARAVRVTDNVVHDNAGAGIAIGFAPGAIITGNTVRDGYSGVELSDDGVADAVVQGNVITGNAIGLDLFQGIAPAWGATVSGNDIVDNGLPVHADLEARLDGNYWGHDACPAFLDDDRSGPAVDCSPSSRPIVGGAAAICPAEGRPHLFDGLCTFSAPDEVVANGGTSTVFTVSFAYDGSYAVDASGPARGTAIAGEVSDALWTAPIEVPEGTRHLRLRLALAGDDVFLPHDLDLVLFEDGCVDVSIGACPIVASSFAAFSDEAIDLVAPAAGGYVIGVDPFQVADAAASFVVTWWAVPEADGGALSIDAPSVAVDGGSDALTVSWDDLGPGRYLAILDHRNAFGVMRSTFFSLTVP